MSGPTITEGFSLAGGVSYPAWLVITEGYTLSGMIPLEIDPDYRPGGTFPGITDPSSGTAPGLNNPSRGTAPTGDYRPRSSR